MREVVGPELVDDAGEHILELLGLGRAGHDVGVGGDGRLHLGVGEVDHVVVFEDVHLLDAGDDVDAQALEGVREALVVGGGGLVQSLLLPVWVKRNEGGDGQRTSLVVVGCADLSIFSD